jgi:hypothetical protein
MMNGLANDIVSMRIEIQSYEDVSKSFRTGRLERELQIVQLSAIRCGYIAILCQSSEFCRHNPLCCS